MVRKISSVVLIMAALALPANLFGQSEDEIWWGSYYKPGNIAVSAAVGLGFNPGFNFSLMPGAEVMVHKYRIAETIPLDIGVSVRGLFYTRANNSLAYNAAGLGAYGTVHLGFKGIQVPLQEYLHKMDLFVAVGLAFNSYTGDWGATAPRALSFASYSGVNYFLSDHLAVGINHTYFGGLHGSATVMATYKIGKGEDVKARDFNISYSVNDIKVQAALMQFQGLYWTLFAMGGFMFSDESYDEGEGTIWEADLDGDTVVITKALLRNNENGSKWWKAIFELDGEEYFYEFLVDGDGYLEKLRFRDVETDEVLEYIADKEDVAAYWDIQDYEQMDEDELAARTVGKETVRVKAGRFDADHIVVEDDESGGSYDWWITDEVPGKMVKFMGKDGSNTTIEGELTEILENEDTELDSF